MDSLVCVSLSWGRDDPRMHWQSQCDALGDALLVFKSFSFALRYPKRDNTLFLRMTDTKATPHLLGKGTEAITKAMPTLLRWNVTETTRPTSGLMSTKAMPFFNVPDMHTDHASFN